MSQAVLASEQTAASPFLVDVPGNRSRDAKARGLRVCPRCNAPRLVRHSRKTGWQVFLSFFSIFPFKCHACMKGKYCFVFSWYLLHTLWISLLLGWTGYLAWNKLQIPTRNLYEAASANYTTGGTAMTSFEKMVISRKRLVLQNDDIVSLVKAGISDALVLSLLHDSDAAFDLTPVAIVKLKKDGVDESLITAMLQQNRRQSANPVP